VPTTVWLSQPVERRPDPGTRVHPYLDVGRGQQEPGISERLLIRMAGDGECADRGDSALPQARGALDQQRGGDATVPRVNQKIEEIRRRRRRPEYGEAHQLAVD